MTALLEAQMKNGIKWHHREVLKSDMARIDIYPDGARFTIQPAAGWRKGKPPPPSDEHGPVQFSRQSRKRLRAALLTTKAGIEDFKPYAVTLTVPGPVCSVKEYKQAFNRFSWIVNNNGWSAIWRAEVQQRGALHWHLKLWGPWAGLVWAWVDIRSAWFRAIDTLGPIEGETAKGIHVKCSGRSMWPGADQAAVDVQCRDTNKAWNRYLADHASKTKISQVGENIGRHWGIFGRCRLVGMDPLETFNPSSSRHMRVVRCLERLARPGVPAACVFGRKLGYKRRLGRSGTFDTFTNPETIRRMITYANGR